MRNKLISVVWKNELGKMYILLSEGLNSRGKYKLVF